MQSSRQQAEQACPNSGVHAAHLIHSCTEADAYLGYMWWSAWSLGVARTGHVKYSAAMGFSGNINRSSQHFMVISTPLWPKITMLKLCQRPAVQQQQPEHQNPETGGVQTD
jgi:hypothetical protein